MEFYCPVGHEDGMDSVLKNGVWNKANFIFDNKRRGKRRLIYPYLAPLSSLFSHTPCSKCLSFVYILNENI